MTHTTVPWFAALSLVESEISHGNEGYSICDCTGPDAEANAPFIVRSVNAHTALVTTLEKTITRFRACMIASGTDADFADAAVSEARAVLALARGDGNG